MADTTVKKIICSSCGAEFEDTLPKCPYCGSLNYKGAEAEYLGKLESMRQDMQQLEQVPEKELKKNSAELEKLNAKLANPGFVNKAQEHVVKAEQERSVQLTELVAKLKEQLSGM